MATSQKDMMILAKILSRADVPRGILGRLIATYGASKALSVFKKAPFKILRDIGGVSLEVADRAAQSVKCSLRDRVQGHAEWALASKAMSLSMLIAKLRFSLELPDSSVKNVMEKILQDGDLVQIDSSIVTKDLYDKNVFVASQIRLRSGEFRNPSIAAAITTIQNVTDDQQRALHNVAHHRLSIITGGPGTGKSHIIRELVSAYPNSRVTAPTGRAARNASGKTVHYFKTIQESGNNDFAGVDLIVVDEASMLSTLLFWNVLQMASSNAHIVLVGDVDQLPPIDSGDVLHDLIESSLVPTTILQTNHRCSLPIQDCAKAVLEGRMDIPDTSAIEIVECDTFDEVIEKIPTLNILEDIERFDASVILTPHNATRIALNKAVQLWRWASDDPVDINLITSFPDAPVGTRGSAMATDDNKICVHARHDTEFTASLPAAIKMIKIDEKSFGSVQAEADCRLVTGDKIIVTKNTPDVCNGDMGVFVYYTTISLEDGNNIQVPKISEMDPGMTLAYAVTVHKAQGSEFDQVVLPITNTAAWDRSLLYTALTRARHKIVLLGTRGDFERIIMTVRPRRSSILRALLR
jgi:ATP-dependent exoDNAse (exonuclease V) alpha subunit